MNNRALRPDLRELVGVSMNTSSLVISGRSAHVETPLLRIAGLGSAGQHVHHGADLLGVPVTMMVSRPEHRPDPQDVITADLASNLWHICYAGQHDAVPRATVLLARWMSYRTRMQQHFDRYPPPHGVERDSILRAFAAVVLHEWLSGTCVACGGIGKLYLSRSGSWIRPGNSLQRNATRRVCPACNGSKRQAPSHGARARALGLTHQAYEQQRWAAHFKVATTAWLNTKILRLMRALTIQLERSKRRD